MAELVEALATLAPLGVRLRERVDVNMAYVELPSRAIDAAVEAGVLCYRIGPDVRLVTSWQTRADDVAHAVDAFRGALLAAAGDRRDSAAPSSPSHQMPRRRHQRLHDRPSVR
jgi:hypothetical protein